LISAVRIRKDINKYFFDRRHTTHIRCFDFIKERRAKYSKKVYVVFLYGDVKLVGRQNSFIYSHHNGKKYKKNQFHMGRHKLMPSELNNNNKVTDI
jgi:hypothetical protein